VLVLPLSAADLLGLLFRPSFKVQITRILLFEPKLNFCITGRILTPTPSSLPRHVGPDTACPSPLVCRRAHFSRLPMSRVGSPLISCWALPKTLFLFLFCPDFRYRGFVLCLPDECALLGKSTPFFFSERVQQSPVFHPFFFRVTRSLAFFTLAPLFFSEQKLQPIEPFPVRCHL